MQALTVGDRILSRAGVPHLVETVERDLVRLRPVNEENGPASLWTPRTLIVSGEIQTELTYLLLACDTCGRQFDPGEAMVTAALRRAAEVEGWNGNFCPNCQEKP
jgi:hypothetical protein